MTRPAVAPSALRAEAAAIAAETRLPLQQALQPSVVLPLLEQALHLASEARPVALTLERITLRRHKPGRRCLIAYDLKLHDQDALAARPLRLLGKIRARGLDRRSYRLQRALYHGAFSPASPDRIHVPATVAVVPSLSMWLQQHVPGNVLGSASSPIRPAVLARVAAALAKLHRQELPLDRTHTPDDELAILDDRLGRVAAERPAWGRRLTRLLRGSRRLARDLGDAPRTSIHRDAYPAQLLLGPPLPGRPRLYLLDFDLAAVGDPALDVGNFIGHLLERGLRDGRSEAACGQAMALEQAYLQRAAPASTAEPRTDLQHRIGIYTTLTLARHIYLSTCFADRRPHTEDLLELCEVRLARQLHARPHHYGASLRGRRKETA